jgi:hypothetical protein
MMFLKLSIGFVFFLVASNMHLGSAQEPADRARARDIGVEVGLMKTGVLNAITDVPGVMVGHRTLFRSTPMENLRDSLRWKSLETSRPPSS